jgi:hypothetical protein
MIDELMRSPLASSEVHAYRVAQVRLGLETDELEHFQGATSADHR